MKEDLENEKDDQIVELFRQGKTYRQIGDELGFPISTISSKKLLSIFRTSILIFFNMLKDE